MKVLVACERSQRVAAAFREKGHASFSCDLVPTYGDPSFHIIGDALEVACSESWDLMIAFPPCTYLSKAGNSLHSLKRCSESLIRDRAFNSLSAAEFFLNLMSLDIPKICIENPVGIMSSLYRRPDQIIHPFYFCSPGSSEYVSKATCLWLKGLFLLTYSCPGPYPDLGIRPNGKRRNFVELMSKAEDRFITFNCVAAAMAEQWG